MGANVKALIRLSEKIGALKDKIPDLSSAVVERLGADTLALATDRTPVGRYSNHVEFTTHDGKKVEFDLSFKKLGGQLRRGWSLSPVRQNGATTSITLTNRVPYAEYVEYGHRTPNHTGWVEGYFMATTSAQIVQNNADKVVKSVISRKLSEVLNDK